MRHVLAYLLFVGGPLAGLLGILQYGQRLEAPPAVHGSYAIERTAPGDLPRCLRYLLSPTDSSLRVSQSGNRLSAVLGPEQNIPLRGRLSATGIELTGTIGARATPDSAGCTPGASIRWEAQASRSADGERLAGTLTLGDCDACVAAALTAVRPRGYVGRRRP